ncbi:MAG: CpsB/CapC family capsule biosynthesis tyrosine phosphatase [Hyphomicrobiales bacterium]
MIDLHSHILPGVDDGAPDIETALDMARAAVDDGVVVMACTPHFMPGLYDNEAGDITRRVADLNDRLQAEGIDLALVTGSDAHIRPDFLSCLRDGRILTLHGSRYVLFEPPHTLLPQRLDDLLFNIIAAGYVPILTHPERLEWLEPNYGMIQRYVKMGVWMQVTAGSLTGDFGRRAQYWGQKLLADGLVHILASDAHNTTRRPPGLSKVFKLACEEVGLDEATELVVSRPEKILENAPVEETAPIHVVASKKPEAAPFWRRLFQGTAL